MDFCVAAKQGGIQNDFAEKMSTVGSSGACQQNYERDVMRDAKRRLGIDFELYKCSTVARCSTRVTKDMNVGMLLPHEVMHWLTQALDYFTSNEF